MNKDIQTLIERETEKRALESVKLHHSDINSINAKFEFKSIYEDVMFGANIALSLFKWKKVTEELPDDNSRVLIKSKAGRIYLSCYTKQSGFSSNANIAEWMPIPNND